MLSAPPFRVANVRFVDQRREELKTAADTAPLAFWAKPKFERFTLVAAAADRARLIHVSHAVPEQTARFRSMTPEERWHAAMQLYWSMRRLKAAYVRSQHPEWSDEAVDAEVKRAFTNVRN